MSATGTAGLAGGASRDGVELQADTISVAYTIGGLSIKYADSSVDNDGYSSGTNGSLTTLSIGIAY